jgi:hypothetical protein
MCPGGAKDAPATGGFFMRASNTYHKEGSMDVKQQGMVETLLQVRWFLDHYPEALGLVSGASTRTALDEVVRELEGNGTAQHGAHRRATSATPFRKELRETLRVEHMQPIAAIAKAQLLGSPATLMQKFELPDKQTPDVVLITAARAMSKAAAEYEQLFLAEKLPSDFIPQLDAAANALQDALVERNGSRLERRRATTGLESQLFKAREVIRVLNGLVVKQIARNPDLLAEWKMAKRVRQKPGVPRGSGTTPTAATPTAATPTAATPTAATPTAATPTAATPTAATPTAAAPAPSNAA